MDYGFVKVAAATQMCIRDRCRVYLYRYIQVLQNILKSKAYPLSNQEQCLPL